MAKYEKSCALSLIMLNEPDGRTEGGVQHQCEKLAAQETQYICDKMTKILKDLEVCPHIRPKQVATLPMPTILNAVEYLLTRLAADKWPLQVRQALMDRRVSDNRKTLDGVGIADMCWIFGEISYDVKKITLPMFHDVGMQARAGVAERLVIKETLVAWIHDGRKLADAVLRLVQHLKSTYKSLHPLALGDVRGTIVEWIGACDYAEMLLDPSIGAEAEELTLRL